MSRTLFMILGAAATFAAACSSEIDGKPKARIGELAEVAGKSPTTTRTLKLDRGSSAVGFVGAKITGDHKGSFGEFDGEVLLAGDVPASLRLTVQTASVKTDAEGLTDHLKESDFFAVEEFPTATFTGKEFTPRAADGSTHEIGGELELRGVKKAIRFPAKLTVDAKGARGQAEFTINRQDFGIVHPGKPDDLIKDEVLLKLDLAFKAG